MNQALQSLIDRYQPQTLQDWENTLKEIVQELALLGLWRAKFHYTKQILPWWAAQ